MKLPSLLAPAYYMRGDIPLGLFHPSCARDYVFSFVLSMLAILKVTWRLLYACSIAWVPTWQGVAGKVNARQAVFHSFLSYSVIDTWACRASATLRAIYLSTTLVHSLGCPLLPPSSLLHLA